MNTEIEFYPKLSRKIDSYRNEINQISSNISPTQNIKDMIHIKISNCHYYCDKIFFDSITNILDIEKDKDIITISKILQYNTADQIHPFSNNIFRTDSENNLYNLNQYHIKRKANLLYCGEYKEDKLQNFLIKRNEWRTALRYVQQGSFDTPLICTVNQANVEQYYQQDLNVTISNCYDLHHIWVNNSRSTDKNNNDPGDIVKKSIRNAKENDLLEMFSCLVISKGIHTEFHKFYRNSNFQYWQENWNQNKFHKPYIMKGEIEFNNTINSIENFYNRKINLTADRFFSSLSKMNYQV